MMRPEGVLYGPERIAVLRRVLDAAWEALSSQQQAVASKSDLALRILKIAGRGEMDPVRLRQRAVSALFPVTSDLEKRPGEPSVHDADSSNQ
jgi:hypothetical protein